MKIVMIGTGYVGLVSGACFADFGHQVTCVDKDETKIEALRAGNVPFYEPGLEDLVISNVRLGRLFFATDLRPSVADADIVFIAVGTPSRRGDGFADLGYVEAAAREIADAMTGFTVVVNKSTVPVGTADMVNDLIKSQRPEVDFAVVSNPEFLREGSAIGDFKRPDRVIVGTDDSRARDVMRELYRPLYIGETPVFFTDRRTSELTKYAANAFLATKITFINEIANVCEALGANVQDVAKGIGLDRRIGRTFLHAGPGFGGSCFPKDTMALVKSAGDAGQRLSIVEAVIEANATRKKQMAQKIIAASGGTVTNKKIAVLGLTFKPNTDDMRDAPSLDIIPELQRHGAIIHAYDPKGMKEAASLLADVTFQKDSYDCLIDADALVIVTEWDEFRALDLTRVKSIMKGNVVVDLRNIYNPKEMQNFGFNYYSIGRLT